MRQLLTDPRLGNFCLLAAYALNAGRWAWAGSWPDVLYWLCAFGLLIAVTFGYTR